MSQADYSQVLEEVLKILRRMVKPPAYVAETSELARDLGLDSLAAMELIEEVEDAFDISFVISDLSKIRTVKDFALRILQEIEGTDGTL